jgi:hypothetical protein
MGFVIERTARYEEAEILERKIQIRVKYSIREMATLSKYLDKFRSYSDKIDRKANDNDIKGYEEAVAECVELIVKDDEDKKYVRDWVISSDKESDDIIDIREFVNFVQYVLKIDEDEAKEDTGKAEAGSEKS